MCLSQGPAGRASTHLRAKCSCHPKRVQQGTAGWNTRQMERNSILQIFCQKRFLKISPINSLRSDQMIKNTKRHQGLMNHCGKMFQDCIMHNSSKIRQRHTSKTQTLSVYLTLIRQCVLLIVI